MRSDDERVAVVAANAVLDRALGKPRPASEETREPLAERLARMTPAQRRARLAELTKQAAEGFGWRVVIEDEAGE